MSDESPSRPLPRSCPLRLRGDLEVSEQQFRGARYWVVKDPVSLEYFRFPEREIALLEHLDGRQSLDEIKRRFDARFAPQHITLDNIGTFLNGLHQAGLLITNAPGQGQQLAARNTRRRRAGWLSRWSNVLAIRFRGVDPDRFLSAALPMVRFLFSRWAMAFSLLVVLAAALLVASQWTIIQRRVPELDTLISARNLIWMAVVLGCAKVLHELGHAFTCKRFGGECHEIGLMLLVFTPCLYCDVSDTWMQPNRWKRMAVTSAGIWIELVLASVGAFGWWYSQPGFFNAICLNVMLVCGLGTILINGNPLLRYDGYYLLSDLADAPNLWQESRSAVNALLSRAIFGIRGGSYPVWLTVYGVASTVYRVFVLTAIVLMLHRILRPHGLQLVAQVITASIVGALLLATIARANRFVANPDTWARMNPVWTFLSLLVLGFVLWGAFQIPVPSTIESPVLIATADAQSVYVQVEGRLSALVREGDRVRESQVLARLANPTLEREMESIRGKVQRQQQRLRGLHALRAVDENANNEIPEATQLLTDLQSIMEQKQRQFAALEVSAPRDGVVLPPENARTTASQNSEFLEEWTLTPLDPKNEGCWLGRMTEICRVGDKRFEAIVFVEEADVALLRPDQLVRIRLDMHPGRIWRGRVSEIAAKALDRIPKEMLAGKEIPYRYDEEGTPQPVRPHYQVRVVLDEGPADALLNAKGRAKITVAAQTVAARVGRFLRRTFRDR